MQCTSNTAQAQLTGAHVVTCKRLLVRTGNVRPEQTSDEQGYEVRPAPELGQHALCQCSVHPTQLKHNSQVLMSYKTVTCRRMLVRCEARADQRRALSQRFYPSALTAGAPYCCKPALSQRSAPALSQRLLRLRGLLACCNPRSHSAQAPRSHSAFSGPLLAATRALTALNPRALTAPSRAPCLLQSAPSQCSTL